MDTPASDRDDEAVFTLLYVSELAAGGAAEIDQICRESPANNRRDRITGVLVFVGHAFCQFVEGSEPAIAALHDRLERDRPPEHARSPVRTQPLAASLHVMAPRLR